MKKLFWIFALLLCLACNEQMPEKTDLIIYLDYTEGQTYAEQVDSDADKILELMKASDDMSRNYGKVRLIPIHDIASSSGVSLTLKEGKSALEGNKYIRKKELNDFKTKLIDKVTSFDHQYQGKELKGSHIFVPFCKGVKKLDRSDARYKMILIYSDMLENSELGNLHARHVKLDKMSSQFDGACQLSDLSEIEIYVVHPVDKNNDGKIRKASDFWREYLVSKGMDGEYFHFETSIDL